MKVQRHVYFWNSLIAKRQGWPRLELVVRGADSHGRHRLAGGEKFGVRVSLSGFAWKISMGIFHVFSIFPPTKGVAESEKIWVFGWILSYFWSVFQGFDHTLKEYIYIYTHTFVLKKQISVNLQNNMAYMQRLYSKVSHYHHLSVSILIVRSPTDILKNPWSPTKPNQSDKM